MSELSDFEKNRRELIRWRILVTLNIARPIGAPEDLLLRTMETSDLPVSQLVLRKELDYLRDRDLVKLTNEQTTKWHAELTRYGVDVVEYTVDCHPGIARPSQV